MSRIWLATKAEVIIKNQFNLKFSWSDRRKIRNSSKSADGNEYDIAILYVIDILDELSLEDRCKEFVKDKVNITRKLIDYSEGRNFFKTILDDIEKKHNIYEINKEDNFNLQKKELPNNDELIKNPKQKVNTGNLYLAKIMKLDSSSQVAYVDYGEKNYATLQIKAIHPDYFNTKELSFKKLKSNKFKIQEVMSKGQIILVQAAKIDKNKKTVFLTTYVSIAGKYSILMPNALNIDKTSRKKNSLKNIHKIIESLKIPNNISLIIRKSGLNRNRIEIKNDYKVLHKTWEKIKVNTLSSVAPILIHQEDIINKKGVKYTYAPETEDINHYFTIKEANE